MKKTILSITSQRSIRPTYRTTIAGQSGPGSDGNEEVTPHTTELDRILTTECSLVLLVNKQIDRWLTN